MRFMVIVKATKSSEAGNLPRGHLLAEMGEFNEDLIKAGLKLAGEGLQASSKGARVKFAGEKRIVIDGPFAETKELVAGFWLWKCASLHDFPGHTPAARFSNSKLQSPLSPAILTLRALW